MTWALHNSANLCKLSLAKWILLHGSAQRRKRGTEICCICTENEVQCLWMIVWYYMCYTRICMFCMGISQRHIFVFDMVNKFYVYTCLQTIITAFVFAPMFGMLPLGIFVISILIFIMIPIPYMMAEKQWGRMRTQYLIP